MAKKATKEIKKESLVPRVHFDGNDLAKRFKKAESKSVTHAQKFIVRRWKSMGGVRSRIIAWLLLIGFLVMMAGVQLMWYRDSFTTIVPNKNTIYVEGALGPVETLNPLFATTSAEQSLVKLIFSQPMDYDTTGNLGYDLLTDLNIDEAETTYTLTLRKDAKWHDGEPVTADDLLFTINLLKDSTIKHSSLGVWENVDVKKTNQQSIELKLPAPYAPFKHYLTFSILPSHILKGIDSNKLREDQFSNEPIGSGPFQLRFIQNGGTVTGTSTTQAIHLIRNDKYYDGSPKLSRFQMLAYGSQDLLLDALKYNEVNGLADLLPNQLTKVDEDRYNVRAMPTKGGVYMLFNTTSVKLSDHKMRQAVRSGIDTDKLRKNVGGDYLSELFTPIISDDSKLDKPKYSPDMTQVYLDELGWRKKENGTWTKGGEELRFKIAVIKSPELELAADEIGKQLNDLGIKTDTQILDLDNIEQGALQNILQPRDFDILINRINIGADQDVYPYWHSSQANKNGLNFSNYKNAISDDALSSARSKRNPDLRAAKYRTFAARWLDDIPAVGLYQTSANYVSIKSTQSFADDTVFVSSISRYSDVLYWSAGKKAVYKTP